MERKCLDCGNPVIGRVDRKFCSDACRINYNNLKSREANPFIRQINRVLKENRNVLEYLHRQGVMEITAAGLEMNGYRLFWNTGEVKNNADPRVLRVYEYGLEECANGTFIIKKYDWPSLQ